MSNRKCPVCKTEVVPETLPEITGEEGRVAVTVYQMPVLQCANGHRLFPRDDMPLLLLDQLLETDEAGLPASTSKGVLIKHYNCSSCGERLTEPDGHRRRFHVDVSIPQTPPFALDLSLPVHRCGRCGLEQVHSLKEVRGGTPAALARAFKSARIVAGV